MDWVSISIFLAAWFIGGVVNGLTGMGAALVALPLFSGFVPLYLAVPAACLIAGFLSLEMAWRFRAHLSPRRLLPAMLAALPGLAVGTWLLRDIPENALRGGLVVLLLGHLYRTSRRRACFRTHTGQGPGPQPGSGTDPSPMLGVVAGFTSGVCNAAISFAAPPMAVYAELAGWDQRTAKAQLATYFLVLTVLTTAVQAAAGLYTLEVAHAVLLGLPAALLGVAASLPLAGRLPDAAYQRLIRGFIGASALLLVGKMLMTL